MKYFKEINVIENAYYVCVCFASLNSAANGVYAAIAYARESGASYETMDALQAIANKLSDMRAELHTCIHTAIIKE